MANKYARKALYNNESDWEDIYVKTLKVPMLDKVKRISNENQQERRNSLIQLLHEMELPYSIQHVKIGNHWIENIIVSINPAKTRIVIGAHYDSVKGSTGANDNASSVVILMQMAKELYGKTKLSFDFVFFDREEYEDHGSEAYIEWVKSENISAMINLDMCGYGKKIAVSIKNRKNGDFVNLFKEEILEKHQVKLLGFMPHGDEARFTQKNIPNLSIAMLPERDAQFFEHIAEIYSKGEDLSQEEEDRFINMEIAQTMHNAVKDNIGSVKEEVMQSLLEYLLDGLK